MWRGIRIIPYRPCRGRIGNKTWIRAAGGKSTKGRIYSIGNSNYVDKLIYHGSLSLSSNSQDFIELKHEVQTYKESNED